MNVDMRGIYGIVDSGTTPEPLPLVDAMLAGGVRVVQYRAKTGIDRALLVAMHARTRSARACLIVNDDFEAALLADGWHAGQEDLLSHDVRTLRARLGTRIFGVSCDTPALARAAATLGADYVGVGPFASTSTKRDAGTPIGVAGVRAVSTATVLPVVAIGGIDGTNLGDVVSSGAAMAAVVSALSSASDPQTTARDLVQRWLSLKMAHDALGDGRADRL